MPAQRRVARPTAKAPKTPRRPSAHGKGAGGAAGKGGKRGKEEEEDEADVSVDVGDMLGVSSQLSSDTGVAMPNIIWTQAISDEVRKKHRQAAEKVIKDFKEDEARINKKQKKMVEECKARLHQIQSQLLKELNANSQDMVKTLTKRMAHERLIGEKVDQTVKGTVKAVAEADVAGAKCLKDMQESVRAEELVGETAALRLSTDGNGVINECGVTGIASQDKSKIIDKPKTAFLPRLKHHKDQSAAATHLARPNKRPRKTDDTLVDFDDE